MVRAALLSAIAAASLSSALTACGAASEGGGERPTVSVEGETVLIRNDSDDAIRMAGTVGLEVREGKRWVDARPLLEELTGTVVASTLEIRLLDAGEDVRLEVPAYEELPSGHYRVTVAYSSEESGPLRTVARAAFTK